MYTLALTIGEACFVRASISETIGRYKKAIADNTEKGWDTQAYEVAVSSLEAAALTLDEVMASGGDRK